MRDRLQSAFYGALGIALFLILWEVIGRYRLVGTTWPPFSTVIDYLLDPARRSLFHLSIRPAHDQQKLAKLVSRVPDNRNLGTFHLAINARQAVLGAKEHNGIAFRQRATLRCEAKSAIAGQAAQPGRNRPGRFQLAIRRSGGHHERQVQRHGVMRVKEGRRQLA